MNFRILASVPATAPSGTEFPLIVWAGEFCSSKYTTRTAKQYARRKTRKANPAIGKFDLTVELIRPATVYH